MDNHVINRRDKSTVLPNAADVKPFNKQFDAQSIKASVGLEDKFIIAYTGTLQAWYAIEDLIAAFPSVLKEVPKAFLLIVGEGQTRQKLENFVHHYGISHNVKFLGYVNHNKIPEIISIADIVVAPYKEAGMLSLNLPITIFEYLSAGKAIVAPKIGQIVEVLQDQRTALLVTPRCIAELANAIIRLAHDEQLRNYLAENARREAQKYSRNNYIDQLKNIYLNPAIA